jgi:ABC-type molybdate transport system ATPase subunit
VKINDLTWSVFEIETKIKLSFATMLQHNTAQAAVTEVLNIENTAKVVSFMTDPPNKVSVNDIFQIRVKVIINGGSPLFKTKVT